MRATKKETSFRAPAARPLKQIWLTTYRLSRQEFLDAVEQVISRVAHPTAGLHWEYEGFCRHSLFILQPADEVRGLPLNSVALGLHVEAPNVSVSINSADEIELQLYRRLVTELDSLPNIAGACITPCTFIATRPPAGSPDWFNGRPSGVGVFVAPQLQSQGDI